MAVRETPFVVRFELEAGDLAAFGVHEGVQSLVERGRLREIGQALGLGALAGLAVALVGIAGPEVGTAPQWTGLGVGLGLAVLRWVTRPARVRRLLHARILEKAAGTSIPITVSTDETGLKEERGPDVREVPWPTIRAVEVTAEHAFVRDESRVPVIVPRRAFADAPESFDDFVDTCRQLATPPG